MGSLTQVDKLIVPQALRFPQGFISGHPRVDAFIAQRMKALVAQGLAPAPGSKKIYVSRAKMPPNAPVARLLLEDVIDTNLRAEGYRIVYPEQMSFADQLRLYADADQLIFAEGSAFHVYVLVAQTRQKVFNVWRRKVMHPVFEKQLSSFQGPSLEGTSHVREMFMRRDAPNVRARAMSVLDFAGLGHDLVEAGFISGAHWRVPSEAEIEAAKAQLAEVFDLDRPS